MNNDTDLVTCRVCGQEVAPTNARCTLPAGRTTDGIAEWTCSKCLDGPGDSDFPGDDR